MSCRAWLHVSRDGVTGRLGRHRCKECGGVVYSCPDPACTGIFHHDDYSHEGCRFAQGDDEVSREMVVWTPLTPSEVRLFRESLRQLRRRQGRAEGWDDHLFGAHQDEL